MGSSIDWAGTDRPMDEPSCGFMNEHCMKDDTHIMSMVVAGILALILFCAGVITMSIYRKWKIELEIEGLLWKIDPGDIKGYFNTEIVSSPSKVRAGPARPGQAGGRETVGMCWITARCCNRGDAYDTIRNRRFKLSVPKWHSLQWSDEHEELSHSF